jgi:hypothetical protein
LVEAESNKLSRRKKAKARNALETVINNIVAEIDHDPVLRNSLFSKKTAPNRLVVGDYVVVKTSDTLYDILREGKPIFKDLYSHDAALAIVEALNVKATNRVPDILKQEEIYYRNCKDMEFFKRAFERNAAAKSTDRFIYADRYEVVKTRAELALKEIKRFRII